MLRIRNEISSFWQRQITELKAGNFRVYYRKIQSLLSKTLLLVGVIVSAPIVLLIILARPFVLVRFGTTGSNRLGHFVIEPEIYLCTLDQDSSNQSRVDIIGFIEPVCNQYLKRMWARTFYVIPGWLAHMLDRSCRFWTRGEIHHVEMHLDHVEYKPLLNTTPHLNFTQEEEQHGQDLLDKLGIPPGSSWICIHNRDSAYLDQILSSPIQWTYHNYRDFSIQSFVSAAEELTKRGYFVIRMGAIQREALSSSNRMIIDYASCPHRSDFGDIYLSSGCSAYIGSDSGIVNLSVAFRKPVCFVNYSLSIADLIPRQVWTPFPFITKHLFHKEKERPLTLREMFEGGLYFASRSEKFEEAGVEVVSNTPEEICELAIEVDERLRGQWCPHLEDEALQQRFWDIFRKHGSLIKEDWGDIQSPIGSAFLRQHSYLLD